MNVYKRRLLKNSSNWKSKLDLSNTAFHLQPLWLQTLVAIDSESHLTSFPSFCMPLSEVTVLFYWIWAGPFHRQVVNLDLLLCKGFNSEHIVFFLCHIFTWRPMTDRKIEQSYGHCNNFLPIPSKFHFIWKKKSDSSLPEIYKALKPCCHLNWISIARVVACFPQATWSLPSETATN